MLSTETSGSESAIVLQRAPSYRLAPNGVPNQSAPSPPSAMQKIRLSARPPEADWKWSHSARAGDVASNSSSAPQAALRRAKSAPAGMSPSRGVTRRPPDERGAPNRFDAD